MGQPTLTSQRLVLRPYSLADAPSVQELAGDRRIADTTTSIPHPYPVGAAEEWISRLGQTFAARSEIAFAVALRETGALVGTVSLLEISEKHSRAELGYWVAVDHWGRGICTEAVRALIDYANEQLHVTRIVARCMARNPASARVMEKAGLVREGFLHKHTFKDGKYEDLLLYGLVLTGRIHEA